MELGREHIVCLTEQIIRDITDRAQFCLEPISLDIASKDSVIFIDLHLIADDRLAPSGRQGYAISGFPRTLADDEFLKKTGELYDQ
jgi:hypothetical protein